MGKILNSRFFFGNSNVGFGNIRKINQLNLGFTGLLDTYPNAAAAYSIRLLSSTYSGALVEIRRSSDNALKSFYPNSNNELSLSSEDGASTTLSSWIGSDNGFVRTWYDQSGNANNAQQTTAANQPKIINAGSLLVDNGKAAISFNGTNNYLDATGVNTTQPTTYFSCFNPVSTTAAATCLFDGASLRNYFTPRPTLGDYAIFCGAQINAGTFTNGQQIFSVLLNSPNTFSYKNGSVVHNNVNVGTSGINTLRIGDRNNLSQPFDGYIQELISYDTNQSANITAIETNLNTFFNAY